MNFLPCASKGSRRFIPDPIHRVPAHFPVHRTSSFTVRLFRDPCTAKPPSSAVRSNLSFVVLPNSRDVWLSPASYISNPPPDSSASLWKGPDPYRINWPSRDKLPKFKWPTTAAEAEHLRDKQELKKQKKHYQGKDRKQQAEILRIQQVNEILQQQVQHAQEREGLLRQHMQAYGEAEWQPLSHVVLAQPPPQVVLDAVQQPSRQHTQERDLPLEQQLAQQKLDQEQSVADYQQELARCQQSQAQSQAVEQSVEQPPQQIVLDAVQQPSQQYVQEPDVRQLPPDQEPKFQDDRAPWAQALAEHKLKVQEKSVGHPSPRVVLDEVQQPSQQQPRQSGPSQRQHQRQQQQQQQQEIPQHVPPQLYDSIPQPPPSQTPRKQRQQQQPSSRQQPRQEGPPSRHQSRHPQQQRQVRIQLPPPRESPYEPQWQSLPQLPQWQSVPQPPPTLSVPEELRVRAEQHGKQPRTTAYSGFSSTKDSRSRRRDELSNRPRCSTSCSSHHRA
ncbi:hypothetical protein DXG03_000765 [Asterophora parasitica]|uniref:Uncharacterized protein n=1 Tax=Asterophora parasitica TaxID=117018 RepID=A0A9P7GH49_9AGAR|nr:hypothetical protein DXG03_000765 [Asterophora parasitica]